MPRARENSRLGSASSRSVKARRTVRGASRETARPSRSRYKPRKLSISASCASADLRRSASSPSCRCSSSRRAPCALRSSSLVAWAASALRLTAPADCSMASASREPSAFIFRAASVDCSALWRSDRSSSRQARSRRSSSAPRCSSSLRRRALSFRHCAARACVAAKTSPSWSPAWAGSLRSKGYGETGAATAAAMLYTSRSGWAGARASSKPASALGPKMA
mmetsp:Transcript_11815/g.33390  ORF Transcript_11815/g.33390 Transcript_11815/m.33390 type:complete len:222 (+) Transcript_11815:318-983(+)